MKSPFRSIRQKLFTEGKLVRYLGYAVGEIALIIIGIMVALELNNRNEDKKAQAEFDLYIVQLREDVSLAISVAEDRAQSAKRRVQQTLKIIKFVEDSVVNQEELEEFEFLLALLGNYSFTDLDYGYLGQLLNGNLDAVIRDNELSRQVLSLTSELEEELRILGQMEESCSYLRETLSRHRGGVDQLAPEMRLAYDIESLRSSDEFTYATQRLVDVIGTTHSLYDRIKENLQDFLAVLEEY